MSLVPRTRGLHPAREPQLKVACRPELPSGSHRSLPRPGGNSVRQPGRTRWPGTHQPRQDNGNGPRSWGNQRQKPGQGASCTQPPSLGNGWSSGQGGPRYMPRSQGNRWSPGQGGPRSRPPLSGNNPSWRPEWRSTGDYGGQPSTQQQNPPGQRLRQGCYVCGQIGCHPGFHREDSVPARAPPVAPACCYICGQRGCHSSRHVGDELAPAHPDTGTAAGNFNPPSNWQRGSRQGERDPPSNVPSRPQNN